jgi:sorbitol-specific phosphotransferase system component IIBC
MDGRGVVRHVAHAVSSDGASVAACCGGTLRSRVPAARVRTDVDVTSPSSPRGPLADYVGGRS